VETPAAATQPVDGRAKLAILKPLMHSPLDTRPTLLARAVAALAAGLLMALTVLAASPELHERLHGHGVATAAHQGAGHPRGQAAADDEDGCIVTLFSQGAVLPVALLALVAASLALRSHDLASLDRIAPESPRYLRLPAQGPPACRN
jgi:hypothetical protein